MDSHCVYPSLRQGSLAIYEVSRSY